MRRTLTAATLALTLALVCGAASATRFSFSTGNGIDLRGDRVVITPKDRPAAEISPAGELSIAGLTVAANEKDRMLLVRYNKTIRSIRDHALDVGMRGAGIAFEALSAAAVALITGDSDAAKRQVEPSAERLKEKARALCTEVKALKQVQDEIAADLAAFRPYALMDEGDAAQCHVED